MVLKNEHLYVEKRLKPGWYMYWEHQTYRIVPSDMEDPLTLYAENTTTAEVRSFSFTALWCSNDDETSPIFAPTLEKLRQEIDTSHPIFNIAPTRIPAKYIAKPTTCSLLSNRSRNWYQWLRRGWRRNAKLRHKGARLRKKRRILKS